MPNMHDLLESKCIFFGSVPKIGDLICMILTIDLDEKKDKSVKSDFHWQILKCRILIFSAPNVIASPVLNSLTQIYMIVHKNLYNTNFFKRTLINNNLKILKESQVTSYVFEACLKYTLLARIAPKWNIVDNLLIEGRNFLIKQEPINGVKYNIAVNGNQIVISVTAFKVRLNCISVDDFLDSKNIKEDENNDFWHEKHWVKVLPSMKRGRIVSVSKTFPKHTCFKDYTELRRHWKNIYGYRLPEDDKEIIYLGIHFFGTIVFTYPIHCVRTSLTILPNRHNFRQTIYRFISDLKETFSTVCDIPFHLKNEFGYAVPELLKINSQLDAQHPNWIQEAPSSHRFEENNEFIHSNQKIENEKSQIYSTQTDYDTQDVSLCTPSQAVNDSQTDENTTPKTPIVPSFIRTKSPVCYNFTEVQSQTSIAQNNLEISKLPDFMQNLMKPIKPVFIRPKKVNVFEILKNKPSNGNLQFNNHKKTFFPNKENKSFQNYNLASLLDGHSNEESKNVYNDSNIKKKITPIFQNNIKNSMNNSVQNFKKNTSLRVKEENLPEESKENSNIFTNVRNFKQKILPIFQNKSQNSMNSSAFKLEKCNTKDKEVNFIQESKGNLNIFSMDGNFKIPAIPIFQNKTQNNTSPNMSNLKKPAKRKEETLSENKIKKPRIKQPKSCDIKQMGIDGTLAKANVPSLTEYLKMNNIPYKSKDKKGDLINKVLNHLNISISN